MRKVLSKKLKRNQNRAIISKEMDPRKFTFMYFDELKRSIDGLDMKKIELAIDMVMEAYINGKNVFVLGNGGSASTASHMACDLGKGTLQRVYDLSEKRFRVISLTDNVALMTAFANDLSFNDVFIQQLRNLVETDDLVIAMSGSGNSENVVKAIEYAGKCGAKTIGLLGSKTGGKLAKMVDCAIVVNSIHYGPIEDIHLILNHVFTSWISKIKNTYDGLGDQKGENKAAPFR